MKRIVILTLVLALAGYIACGIAAMLLLPAKIAEAEKALPDIEIVLSKIANDQLLVLRRVAEITDNTLAKGMDKAAEVDAILSDSDLNRLALTYLGSDWSIQRSAFLGSVRHMRNLLTMQQREREAYVARQKKLIDERERANRRRIDPSITELRSPTRWYRDMRDEDNYKEWWKSIEESRRAESLRREQALLDALRPNEKDIEAKAKAEAAIFEMAQEYQNSTVGVLNRVMAEQKADLLEQESVPFRLRQRMSVFNVWPLNRICEMPLENNR